MPLNCTLKNGSNDRGTSVVQSVKCPTLDFSPGSDLTVPEFKAYIRLCTDAEPGWDSRSLPLSAPPLLVHARTCLLSPSLSQK